MIIIHKIKTFKRPENIYHVSKYVQYADDTEC